MIHVPLHDTSGKLNIQLIKKLDDAFFLLVRMHQIPRDTNPPGYSYVEGGKDSWILQVDSLFVLFHHSLPVEWEGKNNYS
jgi:hypothetical protein